MDQPRDALGRFVTVWGTAKDPYPISMIKDITLRDGLGAEVFDPTVIHEMRGDLKKLVKELRENPHAASDLEFQRIALAFVQTLFEVNAVSPLDLEFLLLLEQVEPKINRPHHHLGLRN